MRYRRGGGPCDGAVGGALPAATQADVERGARRAGLLRVPSTGERRIKLHSANTLERLNGGLKRRSDVVDIFPPEWAIVRLVGALLLEQNDECSIECRSE